MPAMRLRHLFLLLIVLLPLPGLAKGFRCIDAAGHVSLVDGDCPGAIQRHEWIMPAVPEATRKPAPDPDAAAIAAWVKASRARLPPSLGGSARTTAPRRSAADTRAARTNDACTQARERQRLTEREQGFSLGFDARRKLSDAVIAACGLR